MLEIATGQIENRKNEILYKPVSGLDGTFNQEYLKGEIGGIALFVRLPQARIDSIKDELKTQEENENG